MQVLLGCQEKEKKEKKRKTLRERERDWEKKKSLPSPSPLPQQKIKNKAWEVLGLPSYTLFLPRVWRPLRKRKLRTCVLRSPWVKQWVEWQLLLWILKAWRSSNTYVPFLLTENMCTDRQREREGGERKNTLCAFMSVCVCVHQTPQSDTRMWVHSGVGKHF